VVVESFLEYWTFYKVLEERHRKRDVPSLTTIIPINMPLDRFVYQWRTVITFNNIIYCTIDWFLYFVERTIFYLQLGKLIFFGIHLKMPCKNLGPLANGTSKFSGITLNALQSLWLLDSYPMV